METRALGPNGPQVSLVGLGCNNFGWRIDLEQTRKVIDKALDLGINHFDTADIYGNTKSEQMMGEVFGNRRKNVVIATKWGRLPDAAHGLRGRREYIRKCAEASLKRLKTDYIDVYYMHEPDPETPVDETLGALDELIKEGKVRFIAASNFLVADIEAAASSAKKNKTAMYIAAQEEYRLTERGIEDLIVPALKKNGLGLVPFFPLGGGALTGKYSRNSMPVGSRLTEVEKAGENRFLDPHWDTIDALKAFAEKRGHTILELAFSWLAQRPLVSSIIAGATKPEQLQVNATAVNWKLSAEEMAEVDRIVPAKLAA